MVRLRELLFLPAVVAIGLACAQTQDSQPSLGDVARQTRLQKEKTAQAAQGKDPGSRPASVPGTPEKSAPAPKTAKKVVTNDEIPEHIGPTSTRPQAPRSIPEYQPAYYGDGKIPAEYWRNRIQAQKDAIASLKSSIDSALASIRYAGGNCISNCVEWNIRQEHKQQEIESMKMQLEEGQKQLEEMQEMARKQGYGSSVYDP